MASDETVKVACRYCGKTREVPAKSNYAQGVFVYFCDGECEDRYAATL